MQIGMVYVAIHSDGAMAGQVHAKLSDLEGSNGSTTRTLQTLFQAKLAGTERP